MTDAPADTQKSKAIPERHGLSDSFLEILVCPIDHSRLEVVESGLRCSACGRVFTVENGIPNFVIDA
jgi:uncharacterized protein YbaR (Trm112 family)